MALTNQTFMIPTDEGALEAKRWLPEAAQDQSALPWVLLCHPHPLYGGSMDDGILALVREAFVMRGFAVCGFNLPGVGQSTGRSVGDLSEAVCLEAVCRYFSLAGLTLKWAAGYSYGGALLTSALGLLPSDTKVLLIAPAMGLLKDARVNPDRVRQVRGAVVGTADPFSTATLINASLPGIELQELEGLDHFFSSGGDRLTRAIEAIVDGT